MMKIPAAMPVAERPLTIKTAINERAPPAPRTRARDAAAALLEATNGGTMIEALASFGHTKRVVSSTEYMDMTAQRPGALPAIGRSLGGTQGLGSTGGSNSGASAAGGYNNGAGAGGAGGNADGDASGSAANGSGGDGGDYDATTGGDNYGRTKAARPGAGGGSSAGSSANGLPPHKTFYSKVRKLEQDDDSVRFTENHITTRSSAAVNVRCTSIKNRRETDPDFVPPTETFNFSPPSQRSIPLAANRMAGSSSAGTKSSGPVKLRPSELTGASSYQHDYHPPEDQGCIAEKTLSSTKSSMKTLANDVGMVQASSTKDLFDGTAKNRHDIVSNFMGHVPTEGNTAAYSRMNGPNDMLRVHSKSLCYSATVTGDAKGGSEVGKRESSPARRGATMEGFMLERTANATTEERRMNKVEFGIKKAKYSE